VGATGQPGWPDPAPGADAAPRVPRRTVLIAAAVGAALLVAGLAGFRLGAAGGEAAGAPAPAATAPAPAATAPASAGPAPAGVGGDGQAVVVEAVEVVGGTVRVEVTAANPAADERALGSATDPPVLEGADGTVVEAAAADLVLAPLRATRLALTFPAAPAERADLRFNARTDGLGDPAVTVPGVPLRPGRALFARPAAGTAAPADLAAAHPNGTSVTVRTVTVGPDGVAVTVLAVNGGADDVRLAADPPLLEDAAGRRLAAVPAAADPELTVPARGRLTGTLRFAGLPASGARDLTLVLNGRRGADGDRTRVPRLRVAGLPVPAPGTAEVAGVPGPREVAVDLRGDHPGGTSLAVARASFHEDRIQVEVTAANPTGRDVALAADGLVLRDDLGTVHRLSPPPSDPRIGVPAGGTVDATLVFLGPVNPAARALTLVTNPDAPATAPPQTLRPALTIPGIPVPPPAPAPTPGGRARPRTPPPTTPAPAERSVALARTEVRLAPQVVSVAGVAEAGEGQVAAGEASATERALADLGAVRTAEGLVVTLPERVLFAFDDDVVRPDAAATLDRIAAVLAGTPDAAVAVRGHTDRTGDDAYNQDLSERRAAAVAAALVARGTPASRLTAEGYGEQRPVGPDDAADRRVEVVVLLA